LIALCSRYEAELINIVTFGCLLSQENRRKKCRLRK